MVATKRISIQDAQEAVGKMLREKREASAYTCPQKKCARKCGDEASFRKHLEAHYDLLHGPVTREGYLCTICPKAYTTNSRGTPDAAIHQMGHEKAGKPCGLLREYVDFFWLGGPGVGKYHYYGVKATKKRMKGEWYRPTPTPTRTKRKHRP